MDPVVASVRTKAWFENLRVNLSVNSSRAVLKRIEPEGFGKNDFGKHINRNKSSYYANGKHSPRECLVARADSFVPGSSAFFNSVLWKQMIHDPSLKIPASEWLRTLDTSVQRLIFKAHKSGPSQRKCVTTALLESLELKASHDSITALAILLREAFEEQSQDTLEIGRSLLRGFLVYQFQYKNIDVVIDLFEAFRRFIFRFANLDGMCFLLEDYPLVLARNLLNDWYLMAEDNGDVHPSDEKRYLLSCMEGTESISQFFSLAPIIGPRKDGKDEDPETTWQRQMRYESLMCHCDLKPYIIAMERVRPENYAAIPSKKFAVVFKEMMRRRSAILRARGEAPKILWAP